MEGRRMTRTRPDETEEGSAEELRRDAAQYATDAAAELDNLQQMVRELAGSMDDLPPSADPVAVVLRSASITAVSALTSAVLGLSARIGQAAATWAESPRSPVAAAFPAGGRLRVFPQPPAGGDERYAHTSRDLRALPHQSVIVDQDGRGWQRHAPPAEHAAAGSEWPLWQAVTSSPGVAPSPVVLTDAQIVDRGRGPFLVVWRGPGD